jgi:hypothetical protein
MNVSAKKHREVNDSSGLPTPSLNEGDPLRLGAYLVVAIVAFLTGFIVGLSSEQTRPGSRIEWQSPTPSLPHPRSLEP